MGIACAIEGAISHGQAPLGSALPRGAHRGSSGVAATGARAQGAEQQDKN